MDDNAATRERARGRWKILRNALLSNAAAAAVSQSTTTAPNGDDAEPDESLQHSIHCFAGFQMIPEPCPLRAFPTTVQEQSDDDDMLVRLLRQGLTRVFVHTASNNSEGTASHDDGAVERVLNQLALDLVYSLAAWQALCEQQEQQQQPLPTGSDTSHKINSVEWTIETGSDQTLYWPSSWQATIAEMLLEKGYHGSFVTETEATMNTIAFTSTPNTVLARLSIQPLPRSIPTSLEYTVKRYSIPNTPTSNARPVTVLTRERRSQRPSTVQRKRLLHELTSQVHHDGVDNTGNICVWDSERTLTWAVVLQSHCANHHCPIVPSPDGTAVVPSETTRKSHPLVVVELGSGMAALAALSLAVQWSQSQDSVKDDAPPKMHVYITDGHDDSVFNNRVNVRLMQAAGLLNTNHVLVQCRKLLWTIQAQSQGDDSPMSAHMTLVSDCTHFVEYHAELYWTAVHHTRVGGQIYLCQPHRGDSWARFVQLIQAVNARDMAHPLLSLVEPVDIAQHLQSRHEEFERESSVYNANVHRPHVFILTKLREATECDRECVLQYQQDSQR
jgi:Lysine methyltransferase